MKIEFSSGLVLNNILNITQSAICVFVIQSALKSLRDYDYHRTLNFRRVVKILTSTYVPIFFFTTNMTEFNKFLKNNLIFLCLTSVLDALSQIALPQSFFKSVFTERLFPGHFIDTIRKITSFVPGLVSGYSVQKTRSEYTVSRILKHAVRPAIMEEILFRGVVQECLLRQLPKWVMRFSGLSSTMIDHPLLKITRISLSTLLFGIAHMPQYSRQVFLVNPAYYGSWVKLFPIYEIVVSSLKEACLTEQIGILPSIIAHFSDDLYAVFGSQN